MTNKQYVPAGALMKRYGVTRSTIHRWMRDEALGMPRPERWRNRLYWRQDLLDDWDRARAGRDVAADVAAARERFVPKKDVRPVGSAA